MWNCLYAAGTNEKYKPYLIPHLVQLQVPGILYLPVLPYMVVARGEQHSPMHFTLWYYAVLCQQGTSISITNDCNGNTKQQSTDGSCNNEVASMVVESRQGTVRAVLMRLRSSGTDSNDNQLVAAATAKDSQQMFVWLQWATASHSESGSNGSVLQWYWQ